MIRAEDQMVGLLTEILKTLRYIEKDLRTGVPGSGRKAEKFKTNNFLVDEDGRLTHVGGNKMDLALGQNAQIQITGFEDAAGNAAQIDGVPSWSVEGDQGLGDLQIAADGLSALFVRNGTVGLCTVKMAADADLGPDEALIFGTVDLNCRAGSAVKIDLDVQAVDAVPAPVPTPAPTA